MRFGVSDLGWEGVWRGGGEMVVGIFTQQYHALVLSAWEHTYVEKEEKYI